MGHTPDEIPQNLVERLCWVSARRDDSRVASRLYRKPLVDGVYRLDEGTGLDEFLHCLQAIGVMALREEVQGAAIPREMLPFVQDCPALWDEDPGGDSPHPCPAPRAGQ
jgi:hypothetical protein